MIDEEMRAEWLAVTTSCERADRASAEAAITALYLGDGRVAPTFVWVDSPPAAITVSRELKLHRRDSLWVDIHKMDLSPGEFATQIQRAVFDSRMLPVDRVGINFGYRQASYDEPGFVARALYVRDAEKQATSASIDARAEVCRSLWYWWPYKGVCICCERPEMVRFEDGKLHSVQGPAVRFRDGWEVWATNGVVHVPAGAEAK